MSAKLILENGTSFEGTLLDESMSTVGEIVFNTSMSGYQEIFSDPSYSKQIVTMTYPLIGNYGIMKDSFESKEIKLSGVILNELYDGPIHPKADKSLKDFFTENNIPTLINVDCRAITKYIRTNGALKGIITNKELTDTELNELFNSFNTKSVSKDAMVKSAKIDVQKKNIALIDYGYKKSIKDQIEQRGFSVSVFPSTASMSEIQSVNPVGVVLSNGPGDPVDVEDTFELIKNIQDKFPTFGICLGHQVLCLVNGAKTYKMKFGHRGANHSVRDTKTNKVFLSSQNHGYAVDEESLKNTELDLRFYNVNDQVVAGVEHKTKKVLSVQFHPEANSGPEDSRYLFDEFIQLINLGENNE